MTSFNRVGKPALAATLAAGLAAGASTPAAAQSALDLGRQTLSGPYAASGSALGRSSNPAALALPGPRVGLGILGPTAVSYEIGPVSGLKSDIDTLTDIANFSELDPDKAQDKVDKANKIIDRLGEDAYATASSRGKVLPAPLTVHIPAGALGTIDLGLDLEVQSAAYTRVLDDDFETNPLASGVEIDTNTALYIKRAILAKASLGYGRQVLALSGGGLFVGARANYYEGQLSKTVLAVDTSADEQPDLVQLAQDDLSRNAQNGSAVGVDLGALWRAKLAGRPIQASVLGKNLNGPSLDYGTIGQNCTGLDTDAQRNCLTAQFFSDRISLSESYALGPRVLASTTLRGASSPWRLTASGDLLPYYDSVAREYQWLRLAGGYNTRAWYIPDARFGYRHNLAGSGLGLLGAGITLFNVWDIDVASSLETVTIDGNSAPRSMMVSSGVTVTF